ncbi:MAG: hypothetical protein HYV63_30095 [Candidatus Schekmanbacteria bacterium]|nr:hypothetical protein [Candidatus Schekmanbacteria bacterium]
MLLSGNCGDETFDFFSKLSRIRGWIETSLQDSDRRLDIRCVWIEPYLTKAALENRVEGRPNCLGQCGRHGASGVLLNDVLLDCGCETFSGCTRKTTKKAA